jgi:hypothetical protein
VMMLTAPVADHAAGLLERFLGRCFLFQVKWPLGR